MGSRFTGSDSPSNSHSFNFKMEAIKKKMQAMKVEKDNACDQADVSEEKMKAARIRAQKGEDEVEELLIKSRSLSRPSLRCPDTKMSYICLHYLLVTRKPHYVI